MENAKTLSEEGCIFCQIASGQIPDVCYYDDDKYVAFLSIDPNTPGFSCVIPKKHYGSDVLKMPDQDLQEFILSAKRVAKLLEDFYPDVGRVGLIMEGTGINHAHIKLIPMHGTPEMKTGEWKAYASHQEHWFTNYEGWLSSAGGPRADQAELKELTKKLKEHWVKRKCYN